MTWRVTARVFFRRFLVVLMAPALLSLHEMADKAAYLLGIDQRLPLAQKVAKANAVAGVKPYGNLKQQLDNVEKLIRTAALITRELGIPPGLGMPASIRAAAFTTLELHLQPAGSTLLELVQQLQQFTGIVAPKPRVCRLCQQRFASGDKALPAFARLPPQTERE